MQNFITIGEIIKHYRKEKGLSQDALSNGICDRKHLSHIETNKCIPTLDIINQLSTKLQINLYENYALMLRHHNIETHFKIEELIKCYSPDKLKNLHSLIIEYENMPEFSSGEPLQQLLYAKCVYAANILNDHETAIQYAIEGLNVNSTFTMDSSTRYFSNIELSLLLTIMVNLFRMGKLDEGKKYFEVIHKYIVRFFSENHYATNRNNLFELRYLSNTTYNYFLFLKDMDDFDITCIDTTLNLIKTFHSDYMLPELLLCKTYFLLKENDINNAKSLYLLAHHLGLYLYSKDFQEHIEKTTLADYYHQLTEIS